MRMADALNRFDYRKDRPPDGLRQTIPCRNQPLQNSVELCHIETLGVIVLQRICSAPALAEVTSAIAVSTYVESACGFDPRRLHLVLLKCGAFAAPTFRSAQLCLADQPVQQFIERD